MRVDSPVVDGPGKWRLGDIVYIREATAELLTRIGGVCHVPRKCYLVVTGLPPIVTNIDHVRAVVEDMDWKDDLLKGNRPPANETDVPFQTRRRWQCDFDAFPLPRRRALLESPFYLEQSWAQIRGNIIKNKKTAGYLNDGDF